MLLEHMETQGRDLYGRSVGSVKGSLPQPFLAVSQVKWLAEPGIYSRNLKVKNGDREGF